MLNDSSFWDFVLKAKFIVSVSSYFHCIRGRIWHQSRTLFLGSFVVRALLPLMVTVYTCFTLACICNTGPTFNEVFDEPIEKDF